MALVVQAILRKGLAFVIRPRPTCQVNRNLLRLTIKDSYGLAQISLNTAVTVTDSATLTGGRIYGNSNALIIGSDPNPATLTWSGTALDGVRNSTVLYVSSKSTATINSS